MPKKTDHGEWAVKQDYPHDIWNLCYDDIGSNIGLEFSGSKTPTRPKPNIMLQAAMVAVYAVWLVALASPASLPSVFKQISYLLVLPASCWLALRACQVPVSVSGHVLRVFGTNHYITWGLVHLLLTLATTFLLDMSIATRVLLASITVAIYSFTYKVGRPSYLG